MIVFHGRIIDCFAFGVDGCAHTGPCVCCSGCPDATFPCIIKHPHFFPVSHMHKFNKNSVVMEFGGCTQYQSFASFFWTQNTQLGVKIVFHCHIIGRCLLLALMDVHRLDLGVSWVARMPHSTQNGPVRCSNTSAGVLYVTQYLFL